MMKMFATVSLARRARDTDCDLTDPGIWIADDVHRSALDPDRPSLADLGGSEP
jgi:hypothetical protein